MPGLFDLDGPRYGPASGGAPSHLVILLHGLGADGQDLIGLAPHLAQVLPDCAFASPNAPFPCDMSPYGYQWFSVQDRSAAAMLSGVQAAAPALDAFIDSELERHGLTADKLALVGFSQGTMMSLYAAPRRPSPIAGVVGFSGRLIGRDLLAREVKSKPPMLLVHGTADEVVPFDSLEQAETALRENGFEVEALSRPGLGHGIDPEGIGAAARFLQRVLA